MVKMLTVFLAIVVLLTLTSCGNQEVEVTREVKVTRIVKETVVEQVEVTPVFDAEAEKEKLDAVSDAINDAFTNTRPLID